VGPFCENRPKDGRRCWIAICPPLRSVHQAAGGTEFRRVEAFLKKESYPVVLKPIESSGSDGVKVCYTFDEARALFELIMSTRMIDGGANPGVLAQEFLSGKEYIVDNGVHTTTMCWVDSMTRGVFSNRNILNDT
jgi:phosphoribosylamine-glycine ligase